jgi:hypothetical protein
MVRHLAQPLPAGLEAAASGDLKGAIEIAFWNPAIVALS